LNADLAVHQLDPCWVALAAILQLLTNRDSVAADIRIERAGGLRGKRALKVE
jgi:hypothetical protein